MHSRVYVRVNHYNDLANHNISDDFVSGHTAFETVTEFLIAGRSALVCGIESVSWNYFIYENTKFGSWEEMLVAARGAEGSPDKS